IVNSTTITAASVKCIGLYFIYIIPSFDYLIHLSLNRDDSSPLSHNGTCGFINQLIYKRIGE
ncbi:MAG: hypothetical protein RJQ14_07410, partial [Marinoscillum sp.]